MMSDTQAYLLSNNEPELPPLPPNPRNKPKLSRKRTIDEVLYNASSDPPLFSSDDASSTIENYSYQRPKRLHRGTWWSAQEKPSFVASRSTESKRAFKRNYDSGIWMGSDSSFSDVDIQIHEAEALPRTSRQRRKRFQIKDLSVFFQDQALELSASQQAAAKQVEKAVIKNNPTIDLSGMYLDNLPWKILKLLETFTPEPKERYQPFSASLKIYLAHNRLAYIPPELYKLDGLSTLSFRNNELKEISPAISRLAPCLSEVNLSVNKLNYLPMEMNELLTRTPQLSLLRLSDNPFYRPLLKPKAKKQDADDEDSSMEAGDENNLSAQKSVSNMPVYTSRIAYMDFRGFSIDGPVPSRDEEATPRMCLPAKLPQTKGKVPSLYELALRSSMNYSLDQLLHCLGDDVPQSLVNNLRNAAEQAKTGFQACSVCKRKFSIARTEWIEWQDIAQANQKVPLLHRGCSWNCVPNLKGIDSDAKDCGWTAGDDGMAKDSS